MGKKIKKAMYRRGTITTSMYLIARCEGKGAMQIIARCGTEKDRDKIFELLLADRDKK